MKANAYNLMRQLGLMPGAEAQEAQDPVLAELIAGIEPLLKAALAKGQKAPPPSARAMVFLRSIQQNLPAPAPYYPPPTARRSTKELLPIESKVVERTELGRIKKVETTAANGRVVNSTAIRDSLGRMTSILHEMDGKRATARIKRDSMGRIAWLTLDGTAVYDINCDDPNDFAVQLLVAAVENAPVNQLKDSTYVPGRNPLPAVFAQRHASGEIYAVNIGNQQLRPDQIPSRPTRAEVQFDVENRSFVVIRGRKMVITHDFSGQVQALEPLDED